MSILDFLCRHQYEALRVVQGENFIGDETYGIQYQCKKCLHSKVKHGYSREISHKLFEERGSND